MKKGGSTVRYSAKQIEELRRRGAARTDWTKVDAMSEVALERAIAADPDDVHESPDWTRAVKGLPAPKEPVKRIKWDLILPSARSERGRN